MTNKTIQNKAVRLIPTFPVLVLLCFCIISTPLVYVLFKSHYAIQDLTDRSEWLISLGSKIAADNEQMRQQLSAIERDARRFNIIAANDVKQRFEQHVADYYNFTFQHHRELDQPQIEQQFTLIKQELTDISQAVNGKSGQTGNIDLAIDRFHQINDAIQVIISLTRHELRDQTNHLVKSTNAMQNEFLSYLVVFAVLALGIMAILSIWLTRLYKKVFNAITQIGRGSLQQTIVIDGPKDMQKIGEQLDWLRSRLLALEMEKSRFLRHVSHELKTPLANLREGTTLLADGIAGKLSAEQQEVVSILEENGAKLQTLIERLLKYNELKQKPINTQAVDTIALIDNAVSAHQLNAAAKEIEIKNFVEPVQTALDKELMETALDNLISNAIAFSPRKSAIEIRANQTQEHIQISVADHGPGIPDHEKTTIFSPFVQGSAPRIGHLKSSGIGLSIVKDCIDAHHGKVWVEDNEYSGATFILEIPNQQAQTYA